MKWERLRVDDIVFEDSLKSLRDISFKSSVTKSWWWFHRSYKTEANLAERVAMWSTDAIMSTSWELTRGRILLGVIRDKRKERIGSKKRSKCIEHDLDESWIVHVIWMFEKRKTRTIKQLEEHLPSNVQTKRLRQERPKRRNYEYSHEEWKAGFQPSHTSVLPNESHGWPHDASSYRNSKAKTLPFAHFQ